MSPETEPTVYLRCGGEGFFIKPLRCVSLELQEVFLAFLETDVLSCSAAPCLFKLSFFVSTWLSSISVGVCDETSLPSSVDGWWLFTVCSWLSNIVVFSSSRDPFLLTPSFPLALPLAKHKPLSCLFLLSSKEFSTIASANSVLDLSSNSAQVGSSNFRCIFSLYASSSKLVTWIDGVEIFICCNTLQNWGELTLRRFAKAAISFSSYTAQMRSTRPKLLTSLKLTTTLFLCSCVLVQGTTHTTHTHAAIFDYAFANDAW